MSVCVECKDPLVIEVHPDDSDSDIEMEGGAASSSAAAGAAGGVQTVPDDVLLNCGCHFHWQCLLSAYQITQCPSCSSSITTPDPETGSPQILVTYTNEGGVQKDLDILPLLSEESYLKAYPEERRARAFLEFCREGDFESVLQLLLDDEDEDEDEDVEEDEGEGVMDTDNKGKGRSHEGHEHTHTKMSPDALLRYQDPLQDNQSALHCAVLSQSREIAWLLLLLASTLPLTEFPAQVFQEAEVRGIMRAPNVEELVDIRTMRDTEGRSADDLAKVIGGVWRGWEGTGRLAI
ncbi:hypothetical protein GQ43DRAFT_471911 [Delitschia confertaspora ATCC 74209]|uniref:Uncharacterized protein n=1 Tax=Delitschia confertaspora ATCC 74209 TaxID=1513339 RepID=A0A9P4MSA8_9PLEO|nr:hypothetical protein GQ43DRAFT_471911 [Delitschia confertaspora ATCC 74209]